MEIKFSCSKGSVTFKNECKEGGGTKFNMILECNLGEDRAGLIAELNREFKLNFKSDLFNGSNQPDFSQFNFHCGRPPQKVTQLDQEFKAPNSSPAVRDLDITRGGRLLSC